MGAVVLPSLIRLSTLALALVVANAAPAPSPNHHTLLPKHFEGKTHHVAELSALAGDFMSKLSKYNISSGRHHNGGSKQMPSAELTKVLLNTLVDQDPSSSSTLLGAVLGAALGSSGPSPHAALMSQMILAIFSTPASIDAISDPVKLRDPQMVREIVASSLSVEAVQIAISKYMGVAADEIVVIVGKPEGLSVHQFEAYKESVVKNVQQAFKGSLVQELLRGTITFDDFGKKLVDAVAIDLKSQDVDETSIIAWSDVAAPVLANEARNIENQFIDIAARVSSMALEVSGVAKGAGTPDAAMASQVLAGVLAAAGLQGKGRGAP